LRSAVLSSPYLRSRSPPLLAFFGFLFLWEASVHALGIPEFILPAPSRVFAAICNYASVIARHAVVTLTVTLIGFSISVVFGYTIGLLTGYSTLLYRAVNPLLVAFNAIPKVAIVPVLVVWFGVGHPPAILTAFLISFFPIVVNVSLSLMTIEPEVRDVLLSLGASKWDVFKKVGIPRSMPYFFGSLKVASTLSFVGAVISETVASNEGTGYLMIAASSRFDIPLAFAGLFVISILGVLLFAIFAVLEKRVTSWAYR